MNYRQQLSEIHREINTEGILPKHGLQRNSIEYPLICYVNNIFGFLSAENFSAIPIFIKRAHNHRLRIIESGGTDHLKGQPSRFLDLVDQYLNLVLQDLEKSSPISAERLDYEYYRQSLTHDAPIKSSFLRKEKHSEI